jgi:hypothetical protein
MCTGATAAGVDRARGEAATSAETARPNPILGASIYRYMMVNPTLVVYVSGYHRLSSQVRSRCQMPHRGWYRIGDERML